MPACVESIAPSDVAQPPSKVLGPVDVGQLPGMDAALERALRQRGVVRVDQLLRLPKPVLVAAFGDAVGRQLWASARGLDGQRATTAWSQIRTALGRFRGWLTSPCEY